MWGGVCEERERKEFLRVCVRTYYSIAVVGNGVVNVTWKVSSFVEVRRDESEMA